MPDGTPDLQGIWTGGTLTPFERPAQLGTQCPSRRERAPAPATEKFWAAGHKPGDVGRDNDAFIDQDLEILPNGQTSLVVEPADGKVPLRPEAAKRRDFNLSELRFVRDDEPVGPLHHARAHHDVSGRLQQRVPDRADAGLRADRRGDDPRRAHHPDGQRGAQHDDARVRSWGGDSRGHWEGSTLVVETTNFNGRGWIATGANSGPLRGVPYSEQLHIVERFTPVDHDTMQYEITIDDPANYTAPWKIAYPLARDDEYQMFEYACHEGNHAIELILRGARVQERTTNELAVCMMLKMLPSGSLNHATFMS